ncbi:hypothetical protein CR969_02850 [Candidatus Saccharibacteria bacterium]|nr:MAG: hypothetical protein CR969_02850 [Candidatus Saccharibacteria bacterium]
MADDQQKSNYSWLSLHKLKVWQLVILLIMSGFISATLLRLNNVGMIERRDAVIAADEAGDDKQLDQRLYDLQRYVSSHMNADPGRIALDKSYKKLYLKELKKFEQQATKASSNNVVAKVRKVCDAKAIAGGYGRFWAQADPRYVDCINKEWAKYPASSEGAYKFMPPPTASYYQTFISPTWSPDFAGWSVVVTGVILLSIIVKIIENIVLRLLIKRHYKHI